MKKCVCSIVNIIIILLCREVLGDFSDDFALDRSIDFKLMSKTYKNEMNFIFIKFQVTKCNSSCIGI